MDKQNTPLLTLFCALVFLCSASTASAHVLINEVAWMGGVLSSTDEWIELVNPDSLSVDLSGWRIIADDGSPTIVLSGTIAPSGYYLIERTNDDSVPGVTADLVASFGNGLSNGGETLRLKDGSDRDIDVVVGGVDWVNIGGDNVTKQTAQKTTNAWATGIGTPRAANITAGGVVATSTNSQATTVATVAPSSVSDSSVGGLFSKLSPYPRTNIVVEAGQDMRAFAGFPIVFSGSSTGLYNEPLLRATYRWNFGDGSESSDQVVSHMYEFPGEYIATLEVFWSSYHETDRRTVTVIEPDVVITEVQSGSGGYVKMLNNSSREIDISNWVLQSVSGTAMFVFPINSIILPGRYFVLSNKVSKFSIGDSRITLLFPAPLGGIAAEWGTSNTPPNPASVQSRTQPNTGTVLGVNISAKPDSAAARELPALTPQGRGGTHLTQAGTSTEEPVAQVLWQKNPPAPTQSGGFLSGVQFGGREGWLFILIASSLILVAGYVIMRIQRHEASIEDEYAIIEDIIEGVEDQPKIG